MTWKPLEWKITEFTKGPYRIHYCPETKIWDLSGGRLGDGSLLYGKYTTADQAKRVVDRCGKEGTKC